MLKHVLLFVAIFILGGVLTFAVLFGIAIRSEDEQLFLQAGEVYHFADIAVEPTDVAESVKAAVGYSSDTTQGVLLSRSGIPFLSITVDANGNCSSAYLVKDSNNPVLWMQASRRGEWKNLTYSGSKSGGRVGCEDYVDIDYDGNFDYKIVFEEHPVGTAFIYTAKGWEQADKFNHDSLRAMIGEQIYEYDRNLRLWE